MGLRNPNAARVEPLNDKTYLRGAQISDAEGRVRFTTIFPGWYDPRVPHIHVAISMNDTRIFTSQLYFPMDLVNDIHATHPDYADHDLCPYTHETDPVLAEFHDADGLLVTPERHPDRLEAEVLLVLPTPPGSPLVTSTDLGTQRSVGRDSR